MPATPARDCRGRARPRGPRRGVGAHGSRVHGQAHAAWARPAAPHSRPLACMKRSSQSLAAPLSRRYRASAGPSELPAPALTTRGVRLAAIFTNELMVLHGVRRPAGVGFCGQARSSSGRNHTPCASQAAPALAIRVGKLRDGCCHLGQTKPPPPSNQVRTLGSKPRGGAPHSSLPPSST